MERERKGGEMKGRKREERRGEERRESTWKDRGGKKTERERNSSPIMSPAKTSTPTNNVSLLDPSHVNKRTKQRSSQSRAGGSSEFSLHGAVDSTHSSRQLPVQGANHGRKQPLSLFLSKIFIHSTVASKHNWYNLDEILIIRDFNDLTCCGWTGEANKETAKVHPSAAACFPSAL